MSDILTFFFGILSGASLMVFYAVRCEMEEQFAADGEETMLPEVEVALLLVIALAVFYLCGELIK